MKNKPQPLSFVKERINIQDYEEIHVSAAVGSNDHF